VPLECSHRLLPLLEAVEAPIAVGAEPTLALLGIARHCSALLGIARHCSALLGIARHCSASHGRRVEPWPSTTWVAICEAAGRGPILRRVAGALAGQRSWTLPPPAWRAWSARAVYATASSAGSYRQPAPTPTPPPPAAAVPEVERPAAQVATYSKPSSVKPEGSMSVTMRDRTKRTAIAASGGRPSQRRSQGRQACLNEWGWATARRW
jgi:hypothetical protein